MNTPSLIQTLVPTAPGQKSATQPTVIGAPSETGEGQQGTFSLLVSDEPTKQADSSAPDGGASPDEEAISLPTEDLPADLVQLLAGLQPVTEETGIPTSVNFEGVVLVPENPEVGVSGDGDAEGSDVSKGADGVLVAGQQSVTTPIPGSAAPGDTLTPAVLSSPTASTDGAGNKAPGLNLVAPSGTPAVVSAVPASAAAPTLQAQGDILEGGQGAPTAQKILGIGDPKTVSEAAQRDASGSAIAAAPLNKAITGTNDPNTSRKNPAVGGVENGPKSTLLDPQNGQAQDVNNARAVPSVPPVQAARLDVPAQASSLPDGTASQLAPTDPSVSAEAKPLVAVTVRFDQTIQGPQLAAQQLAFHIKRNFANGVSRFEVRLDPPELGRIDVRLDMNADGRVAASLTVDRPETLDLLQRDSRLLQKALEEAGVSIDDGAMNFSLRDDNADQTGDETAGEPNNGGRLEEGDLDQTMRPDIAGQHHAIIEDGRIDIHV